jgi:hypothetical protein
MLLGRELHGSKLSDVTRLCSPNTKGVSQAFQAAAAHARPASRRHRPPNTHLLQPDAPRPGITLAVTSSKV